MAFIYVLQLLENKYYIGKTNNPNFRLEQHFNSEGSEWTKKYKPIKLLELVKGDNYDEDKYTLKYMEKYGINNVRGGSFCEIKLTGGNKNFIEKMITGATDKCYKCGEKGHFAKNCSYTPISKEYRCFRCNRIGHFVEDCYATTNDIGEYIDDDSEEVFVCDFCDKEFDTYQETILHTCTKKLCYRCGRDSHYTYNCYASTHKDGYYI